MRRREFIAGLGSAATTWPLAAQTQQVKVPVVGWLRSTTAAGSEHMVVGFRQGLNETGFFEGQNIMVEYRWANNQLDREPALAAELVRRQVDVIATIGSNTSALAAKTATASIPIVFSTGSDPVEGGLVNSLSRPNGNLTGISTLANAVDGKRLDLLLKLLPQVTRIAGLVVPRAGMFRSQNMRAAVRALGRNIDVVEIHDGGELEATFASLVERRTEALFVGVDPIFTANRHKLVALAALHKIPTSYQDRDFAIAGGLMSYGANIPDSVRQAGVYVGRILKGEKPADLPVQQSTKFEFVINLKAARVLQLDIPPTVLALADEVIE
jgi:putative tryptophan/tyrosine transport system substrate-binding protein